ncbi:MAG: sigma-70 family RNA polymerase sigma factor [Verrucomicrobia bacterium]|nr:sigma-70 family RNA polymerase sigma factor [Verrucomicrobiota bacterium]
MNPDDEPELIARCRGGENRAWDVLFDSHYAATGRFVFQLGNDFTWEDVEEICQEVFLSVIRNLGSFHGKCRLQTWIFQIAANKARDYRQRRLAAKRGGGQQTVSLQAEDPQTELPIDPPGPEPTPDAALLSAERMELLQAAIEQLGKPCREVIELRYFGDLSYEEIAKSLNLNLKTVSSRLSKCLDHLETIARDVFAREKVPLFSV